MGKATMPLWRSIGAAALMTTLAGVLAPAAGMPVPPSPAETSAVAPFDVDPAPADPVARAIDALTEKLAGDTGRASEGDAAIATFYAARNHAPLWMTDSGPTEAARAVMALFRAAERDGLDPRPYLALLEPPKPTPVPAVHPDRRPPVADPLPRQLVSLKRTTTKTNGPTADEQAAREIGLTRAALLYARHAASGRIAPTKISRIITLTPEAPDPASVLIALAESDDPAGTLAGYHPSHAAYEGLRTALASALERTFAPLPELPPDTSLSAGKSNADVALLRAHLGATVRRGTDPTIFDAALREAVKAFQRERGLSADGIVGPRTRAAINGTVEGDPVADILVNMERWRWMPRDLGERHVFVNVPEFMVEVIDGGECTYRGRVIVGKPGNPTPMFSDVMDHIVVNPYWNVPYSIASKEMLPSIQRNPSGYMSRRGYEVVYRGRVVSPSSVSWNKANLRNVRIRQRPGRGNALGSVKFMFPNRHAVYLHDTPTKHLFSRDRRAFSHGCVRVDQPFEFATALLASDGTVSGPGLKRMVGGGQKWVDLTTPVPVHLAYFTIEAAPDGTLTRHRDIYGFDARMKRAFGY